MTLECQLHKSGSFALQLLVKYLYYLDLIILTAFTLKSNKSHFECFFVSSLFIFCVTL